MITWNKMGRMVSHSPVFDVFTHHILGFSFFFFFNCQGPYGELGLETAKSSAKPTFVSALEGCQVLDLACGLGHTLFVVDVTAGVEGNNEAVQKMNEITEEDVVELSEKNLQSADVPSGKKGAKKKGS